MNIYEIVFYFNMNILGGNKISHLKCDTFFKNSKKLVLKFFLFFFFFSCEICFQIFFWFFKWIVDLSFKITPWIKITMI